MSEVTTPAECKTQARKPKNYKLRGLVSAVFTPFTADGKLNLPVIDKYAEYLSKNGVRNVFVNGTTGESVSLSTEERKLLAEKWVTCAKGGRLDNVIIHVGSDCLVDSKKLARHAQDIGADAISSMPPVFMKPTSVGDLVGLMKDLASEAPDTPFYYYHIPNLTGVDLDMLDFCEQAASCSDFQNFCGLKFTSTDLVTVTQCMLAGHSIMFGCDQVLLGAYALGICNAVGSTYNMIPQVYHRMMKCFDEGDIEGARREAYRSQSFVLKMYNYPGCSVVLPKFIMAELGIDCGPCRPPLKTPSSDEIENYKKTLQDMGFYEWIKS